MTTRASLYIADTLPLAGLRPYVKAGSEMLWFDWFMHSGWWGRMRPEVSWDKFPREARLRSAPRLWVRAIATFCYSIRELADVDMLYTIRAAHAPREALLFDTVEWVLHHHAGPIPRSAVIDEIEARAAMDTFDRWSIAPVANGVMAEVLLRVVRRAVQGMHGEDLVPTSLLLGAPFGCGFNADGVPVPYAGSALGPRRLRQ